MQFICSAHSLAERYIKFGGPNAVAACKEALQHAHQPRRLRPVEARLTLGMLRRAALRSARLEKGERRGAARPRETAHRGPRGGVDACSRLQV